MQCHLCGAQLPEGAAYCPACATLTPYGISQSKGTPYDPTSPPSPAYSASSPTIPATDYSALPYAVAQQNPYAPRNPYTEPPQTYAPPPPANSRRRPPDALLLVSIILALVVVGGGVIGLAIFHSASQGASTPTPTPAPYPALLSAYSGSVHNITYNLNANMALTSIVQNADRINGNIRFGLPLVGSGPFTGTVSRTNTIHFVVDSGDMGGVTLTFTGSIVAPGSLNGTYTISNGQNGTWKAVSATDPVVYPLLAPSYTGSLHNNSTGENGSMSLTIVTQNQQIVNGLYDNRIQMNGTVGEDNTIQITTTDAVNGIPITFKGAVKIDGSLGGTYLATNGVTGTWSVAPVQA